MQGSVSTVGRGKPDLTLPCWSTAVDTMVLRSFIIPPTTSSCTHHAASSSAGRSQRLQLSSNSQPWQQQAWNPLRCVSRFASCVNTKMRPHPATLARMAEELIEVAKECSKNHQDRPPFHGRPGLGAHRRNYIPRGI
jgi:hypothetical protein